MHGSYENARVYEMCVCAHGLAGLWYHAFV